MILWHFEKKVAEKRDFLQLFFDPQKYPKKRKMRKFRITIQKKPYIQNMTYIHTFLKAKNIYFRFFYILKYLHTPGTLKLDLKIAKNVINR